MDAEDKRMLEREALRNMIQQWNANRLDLFELSEPNENLEFHGVMRFFFQDLGQKIATKCIRVASDATVSDVIEILIEKFRPDMRMLSLGSYSLWETHGPDDERKLEPHEKPLLVQLNWHADDREGRFLLKCSTTDEQGVLSEKSDQNFKRKLSKREKKELKKKEKLSRLKSEGNDENRPVAEKLYKELPETSFTRSISNPEAVMRRRRQQKLERKLQQFRSKDGGADTGGTLKIYGSSLCSEVPYKTLLLSIGDNAATVVREMLDKYGLSRQDPHQYCIVQVDASDNSEYILEEEDCPLAIVMTHPHRSSIMFHVRRRPADSAPRRRKKKVGTGSAGGAAGALLGAELVEVAPDGTALENARRLRLTDVFEVGSGNGASLQLYGPSIQPRHCVLTCGGGVVAGAGGEGGVAVTPVNPDAHVYIDGRRITHTQRLQHGALIRFGRVSTFRFVDPAQETILNRNLTQSQHFGSGSVYDRSIGENASGAMSPTSVASQQHETELAADEQNLIEEYPDNYGYRYGDDSHPYNNNTLKVDEEQRLNDTSKEEYSSSERSAARVPGQGSNYRDNYETTFDLEGNVETKSICSAKSTGSGPLDTTRLSSCGAAGARMGTGPGQEAILPAVLEFPEGSQAQFLAEVITRLEPHAPTFKLAPAYTLYLCARYRASTHYRPELSPTERAHKLTALLHHVAALVHLTVQERCSDATAQGFWMANASELLHFLKSDRHISTFSTQAQDVLAATVQTAFSNLVSCFQEELSRALLTLNEPSVVDPTEATAPTLQALAAAMVQLRRCRVNAALTIQLFSYLFHYINSVCFNKLVTDPSSVRARWGSMLSARLALVAAWAERQGLELAADCHLARTRHAARLIQGEYQTGEEAVAALTPCLKLNSVQVRALLAPLHLNPHVVEAAVQHARALADELSPHVTLEENGWLGADLLIPGDGFSAEVVRGVPPGLAEFIAPLQRAGLCRFAHQPSAAGLWTVYMSGFAQSTRRTGEPRVQIIQLNKNSNGMGLSIVAAKGAGQSKLGIYIKSVVPGGAAAADGRLAAGDQLLSVDGHSLVGITQEKAAEYLVKTGPTVTLEVAKQGAVLHGLATLLHQPAYTSYSPNTARCYHSRCSTTYRPHNYDSSESSSDESDRSLPHYHSSVPRLIVTHDRENHELNEDLSPGENGCSHERSLGLGPPHQIPVFTFTCEDYDAHQMDYKRHNIDDNPRELPSRPNPPVGYDKSTVESAEGVSMPPVMRSIDTRLTLDLFNINSQQNEVFRRRCTRPADCVSACECCRTPQPEIQPIPFIDEPSFEPFIFENDSTPDKVVTPKTRRILPSLSLDRREEKRAQMTDAVCQTNSLAKIEPVKVECSIPFAIREELKIKDTSQRIEEVHSRLRKALVVMSRSVSSRSDETEVSSSYSTSDSSKESRNIFETNQVQSRMVPKADKILDGVEGKSWKSPDEFQPALGRVKALAKRFDAIHLKYCVKNYKRNCQSSPNLSTHDHSASRIQEILPNSVSLADIHYESESSDAKRSKLTEHEVKSILIQLEDWSRYGSRGSEDTLAQGNEFELPNLPSEDHGDHDTSNDGGYVFNEILNRKPRKITLDKIKLKDQMSFNSDKMTCSGDSPVRTDSDKSIGAVPTGSLLKICREHREQSHADSEETAWCRESDGSREGPRLLYRRTIPTGIAGSAAARRASERDLPSRLASEAVKASRSTPALHRVAETPLSPGVPTHSALSGTSPLDTSCNMPTMTWSNKSRSSHNLSATQPQQNQNSSYSQRQQDRWASLRRSSGAGSTAAGRPQSAHMTPGGVSAHTPLDQLQQFQHQGLQSPHSTSTMSVRTVRTAKLAEMSEEATRRQQQIQPQHPQKAPPVLPHQHAGQNPPIMGSPQLMPYQQQHSPQISDQIHQQMNHMHQQHMHLQNVQNSSQHQIYQNQQNIQQQRYEWHHSGPPSPQKSQPPVAPKPQGTRRSDTELEDMLVQQQNQHMHQQMQQAHQQYNVESNQHQMQTNLEDSQMTCTVLPDDEHYVASALEPPSVGVYPGGAVGAGAAGRAPPAHNPWQREERERQWEARRKANRARRDATIAALVALGAARTPEQSQQLRALQLERDFELRANMHQEEGGGEDGDEVDEKPEPSPVSHPSTSTHTHAHTQLTQPPKSILKTNRTDLTNGYNAENRPSEERTRVGSELSGSMSALSVLDLNNSVGSSAPAAPPPPSRGSSFAVMAERTRTLSPRARLLHPAPPPTHQTPTPTPTNQQQTMCSGTRDKRVSFHAGGAEVSSGSPSPPPPTPPEPPASSPPPLDTDVPQQQAPVTHAHSSAGLASATTHREDPDRFFEEAESMLAASISPRSTQHMHAPTHTPGVIGAQEVYRDPRARRLAEQAERAERERDEEGGGVPEQLSFREKMKMFALEAGDGGTPKDKVKISRAQRDIDAVH